MKEDLSSITITNPTNEDFTWNYNGEPYTVKANESTAFAKPVSYHLAKHLSTQMVVGDLQAKMTKKEVDDPRAAIHVKISQLSIYDTPERRIALYKILGDTEQVIELVGRYFAKGSLGEMTSYKEFVEKHEKKSAKETESVKTE